MLNSNYIQLRCLLLALALLVFPNIALAQDAQRSGADTFVQANDPELPPTMRDTLAMLNVRNVDLKEVLRSIAIEHEINLLVDDNIDQNVTVRLAGLPVIDVLVYLCRQNNLLFTRSGSIFQIAQPEVVEQPNITIKDSLLWAHLNGESIESVIDAIASQSDVNIVLRRGVTGILRGRLQAVPIETGLVTLMENNGFSLRLRNEIYHVDRLGSEEDAPGQRSLWVQVHDGTVSVEVAGAPIARILTEISAQADVNLITYQVPEGAITARFTNLPLETALEYLFKGTSITYRKQGDVYIIGDKSTSSLATTRLIRLGHLKADALIELIPEALKELALIQVVKEHNGI